MSGTKLRRSGSGGEKRYSGIVDVLREAMEEIPPRSTDRLMTFAELQQQIGSKPKKDRMGGLFKMSTRYKDLGKRLDEIQAKVHDLTLADLDTPTKRAQVRQDIETQLDEVAQAGAAYRKKHTGKKGAVVKGLLDDVDRFRGELPDLLLRMGTPGDKAWPRDMHLDAAMAAERMKLAPDALKFVSAKHCRFEAFSTERETASRELGAGSVNKVQLITYGDTQRVFKKEVSVDTSGANAPALLGIDVQNKTGAGPRYGNRNVASNLVGKMLGTSVMPETSFAVHNGEVGIAMAFAPGKTISGVHAEARKQAKAKGQTYDEIDFISSLSPVAVASLQRQLIELEVCDILTGQADRHRGNYMLDVQGDHVTVTAVDNDFAFGKTTQLGVPIGVYGVTSICSMPMLIGKDMADRILAMDFDRDVAPQYAGLLTDEEVAAAKFRHDALVKHVRKLDQDGYVVQDWQRWRSPDGRTVSDILSQESERGAGSLFCRDFAGIDAD